MSELKTVHLTSKKETFSRIKDTDFRFRTTTLKSELFTQVEISLLKDGDPQNRILSLFTTVFPTVDKEQMMFVQHELQNIMKDRGSVAAWLSFFDP